MIDDNVMTRNLMFILSQCTDIFSISVQPKNPQIPQLLYCRRGARELPFHCCGMQSEERIISSETDCTDTETFHMPLLGFLAPYQEYDSPDFPPDRRLEYAMPEKVTDEESIASSIQDILSPTLRKRMQMILRLFLKDVEARKLAMVLLQPYYDEHHPVLMKVFVKVTP